MSGSAGPLTLRETTAIVLAGCVLAVYFTWPLATRPGGMGRVQVGDGQFSVWNVAWVAHAFTTPGVKLFDANIFHPHRRTLAYSEPNIGAGLIAVPAYLATRNPYAAHNSAVLISLVFAVVGMYLLARRLTGSREASFVAAILFAFCPFFFARTSHIQLMMTAPLPLTLLAFHRFADRVTTARAIVLGVAIGVQALFCAYYGVLIGLIVGLGIIVFAAADGRWRRPRWWALSVLAAVVSGLTVLPFFLPFIDLQAGTGFGRELQESIRWSADWRAYFASSAWAHGWMLRYLQRWNEVLFPGFLTLMAGGFGMFVAFRRRQASETALVPPRTIAVFYLLVFVFALWSSFGPEAGLYSLLYYTVPVFSLLRAPARFGIAVTLALSVFAAVGLSVLFQRLSPSRRGWAAAAVALLAIAELSTTIPYVPARDVPQAYRVLAGAEPGPVAEFPFYHLPQDRFRHTMYMLGSTAHWLPLVNGYSDFIPADFLAGAPLLDEFPNAAGVEWLRERGTRYVVFHLGLYDGESRARLRERLVAHADDLRPKYTWGTVHLYELLPWQALTP